MNETQRPFVNANLAEDIPHTYFRLMEYSLIVRTHPEYEGVMEIDVSFLIPRYRNFGLSFSAYR